MDQTTSQPNSNNTPVPEMGNPLSVPPVAAETPATAEPVEATQNTPQTQTAPITAEGVSPQASLVPPPPSPTSASASPIVQSEETTPTSPLPQTESPSLATTPEEEQIVVPPTPMSVDTAMPQNTGVPPLPPPAKSTKLGLALGIALLITLVVGGSVYYYFFIYAKEAVAVITKPSPVIATTTPPVDLPPVVQTPVPPPVDIATQISDEADINTNDEALSASSTDEFIAESNVK